MSKKLLIQALSKFFSGMAITALLLFVPAGTLKYRNGWLFMVILFVPMLIAGLIMIRHNPELLEKRLNAKEQQKEQKTVVLLSGIMFLAAFISAGLCCRLGIFLLPNWIVYAATVLFLTAYLMYAEVLRENEYLSRTIEVQENQTVIDTGLYGIVRHPMYTSTLFLFLSMGLVLGSLISFLILLCYIPIIIKRIKNEEKVLTEGLEGYKAYKEKVKYRLVPYIW